MQTMKEFKQLTPEQRCQIEPLKKSGLSQQKIAEIVGTTQSTISREIRRNTGGCGYRHKQAQRLAEERRYKPTNRTKFTHEACTLIKEKLAKKWSPEQISNDLMKRAIALSHESIYQYIWKDKQQGGMLYQQLRRQGKKYNKRYQGKTKRGQIKNRVSIDLRPLIVETKLRVGDWEIDTVVGKGKAVIVTIVERTTQFTLTTRTANRTAQTVMDATIRLLKPYKDVLHSITADNGKEFAYHEQIAKALDTEFYFAHPYHSWERGLNENTNGLLRQYWPKRTAFRNVSQAEIKFVIRELNDRPRKTLGYETPADLMHNYRMQKVA